MPDLTLRRVRISESLEKVVSGHRCLAFEIRKPKYRSILVIQAFKYLLIDIVIQDVLKVHLVQVVSPWVQYREALMLDALGSILLDILLDELEISLIGMNRVNEVILSDCLFRVADERINRFDAG